MTDMDEITIRHSTPSDLDGIMEVYDKARSFMRRSGNLTQWVDGYPSRRLVEEDITAGCGYVGTDREGRVVMAFAFIIGPDPTYADIDGAWLDDEAPYGTIHRLGSDGTHVGMLRACVDWCAVQCANLRLDTHADNWPMRRGVSRLGFTRCGIIRCMDGTPRIAYQRLHPCSHPDASSLPSNARSG